MASSLLSRNVTVAGHRTSVRLEPEMWDALCEICRRERMSAHDICTIVDARRRASSLTAALRVFVMDYFRCASTEEEHLRMGHGALAAGEPFRLHRVEREAPASAAVAEVERLRAMP